MTTSLIRAALLSVVLVCAQAAPARTPLDTAQEKFEAGRYQEAVQVLLPALRSAPLDAQVHYWLARSYHELRDWDSAIRHGEKAVELAATNADFHYRLGESYGAKADADRSLGYARKSRDEFRQAVRLDPANVTMRKSLMEYLARAPWIAGGSDSEAREQAAAIAALDPIEGLSAWGAYYRLNKKWDEANAQYHKLLEAKPARIGPYFSAANFFLRGKNAGGMKQAIDGAAKIDSSDPRLLYFRGVMHAIAGDRLDEAERLLQAYLQTPPRSDHPSHASAYEYLGKVQERLGKCGPARQSFQHALAIDKGLDEAKDGLKRLKCSVP